MRVESFAKLCETNNFVIPVNTSIQYYQVFPGCRLSCP